ncbi:hypothetical protein FRC00_003415 [Tulasnella sp. 408]|nr:hypothetical protein FRC00_003415 [Tulasnella sp. 408]
MSKGKEKSRSKTSDTTIQAILDAAPSDEARKVLLANPNMMKALLRRASRHTNADGAADTSIFKRIFADEVFNSPPELRNLRQREDRLHDEMKRAQEAELRLLEAQAKVNQLILEKQKANMAAEQAKEEAGRIQMRLEVIRSDIEQRNDAMKKLEEDYDRLDQEAARIRSENYKLKLKEAHAAGRAEGRNEGRTMGRREGEQRGYEEGYGAGFALGSRDMADKLMKYLDEDEARFVQDAAAQPSQGHHRQDSSSSSRGPPAFQELRDPGKRSTERGRDRDREKERRPKHTSPPPSMPVPTVQIQAPSQSTDHSPPPSMPEPVVPPPRSPSPAPRSVTPTPAQQIVRDYKQSPEPYERPIPIRNVSPKPHPVRNPLPDTFIPVVSENDPDGLMFDMPAAHEFAPTPSATAQPLPSQQSPRPSPQMFAHEALAHQNTGSHIPAFVPHQNTGSGGAHAMPFIPPTRELPQPKGSSIRSRENRQGRSESPDRSSTPLSEMSILQRQAEDDAGIYMPYTYQLKRNHSVLSVIQEQSDTDGTSPVAQRMQSQSPGIRRPQYEAAPISMQTPTLSYIPAPLDGSMGVGHPPHQDESAHFPAPMVPNPGQPRVRQFDEARQRHATGASPVMPTYAVAPLPEGPIQSFVPVMRSEVPTPTPFVPPQNKTPEPTPPPPPPVTLSRSSTKKGKKEKKRSQDNAVPEVQIIPPSDKSESSYNRLSQVDLQPQEQPPELSAQPTPQVIPQITPQRSPMRMPIPMNTVNSDSEDSTMGRRPPPIAPQPPPPPAFVPKTAATPPPAPVPFIPPPPVVAKPPTPPPVIPVATGTSRRSSKGKGKGRSRQQAAPVVPPSPVRVSTPITMPVPEVVQEMPAVIGDVVMELPPDATIAPFVPGTVLSPVMADGTGMYEPPPIPAFVPPSPGIVAPTPRVPRSPGLPHLSETPSPAPSRTPDVQPVVPAVTSSSAISAVPNKNPKGFVPKDVDPVAFGYRTPMLGHGRQKVPLGRPNPEAAYSLTARTPRIPTGMATGDGLPAVTPEPGPEARLPVIPPSVSSSSPMAPPGGFDGEPVVPHLTGSQYPGSRQHTGSQQYPGSRQHTGAQQYGMPQQHTGSQHNTPGLSSTAALSSTVALSSTAARTLDGDA